MGSPQPAPMDLSMPKKRDREEMPDNQMQPAKQQNDRLSAPEGVSIPVVPSTYYFLNKQNEDRLFTLKKWNAVAMWSWDVECDTCAICRVQVITLLINYKHLSKY